METKAEKTALRIMTQRRKCIDKYKIMLEKKRKTMKSSKKVKAIKEPKKVKAIKEPKEPKTKAPKKVKEPKAPTGTDI